MAQIDLETVQVAAVDQASTTYRAHRSHGWSERWTYEVSKRAVDLLLTLVFCTISAPLFMAVALAVHFTSDGPVFYRQTRCGRNGKPFTFYKFRTMVDGAHDKRQQFHHLNRMSGPVFKIPADPRVTSVGRWLRKLSLDELPQFYNVLRGDMSLVGPRPPLPEEVEQYTAHQRERLAVKPGLTCVWQVSGRSTVDFDRWVELDLEYIRRRSLFLDLWLLLRTIPAVLLMHGAY